MYHIASTRQKNMKLEEHQILSGTRHNHNRTDKIKTQASLDKLCSLKNETCLQNMSFREKYIKKCFVL